MKSNITPSKALIDISKKVARDIEHLSVPDLRDSLDELVDFHRFLISAYNTKSFDTGNITNFALIGSGRAQHEEWLDLYRRLFEVAIPFMNKDGRVVQEILHELIYIPMRLLPEKGAGIPTGIIISYMNLYRAFVYLSEDWAKQKGFSCLQEDQAPPYVKKTFEDVIRVYVGASESFLGRFPSLNDWSIYETERKDDAVAFWEKVRGSWPLFERHLQDTACAVTIAAWNNNETSVNLYVDALLNWGRQLFIKEKQEYLIRDDLVTPDLFDNDWVSVQDKIRPHLRFAEWAERVSPEGLFASIIQNVLQDIILITSGVLLRWFIRLPKQHKLALQVASSLINGEKFISVTRENDEQDVGETFDYGDMEVGPSFSSLQQFMTCLVRILSCGNGLSDTGYAHSLDTFTRQMDGISEREVVSGRCFTPSTSFRREDLLEPWTSLFCALSIAADRKKKVDEVVSLISDSNRFPEDSSVRNIIWHIQQIETLLVNIETDESRKLIFESILRALNHDDTLQIDFSNAKMVLETLKEGIENNRKEKVTSLSVDSQKLLRIEGEIDEAIFDNEKIPFPLQLFKRVHSENTKHEEFLTSISNYPKGALTTPQMGSTATNEGEYLSNVLKRRMTQVLMHLLINGAKSIKKVSVSSGNEFWDQVKAFTSNRQQRIFLFIGNPSKPKFLADWHWFPDRSGAEPIPSDLKLWTNETHKAADKYLYNLNDIEVYRAPVSSEKAYLIPAALLDEVYLSVFENGKRIKVGFEQDSTDPFIGKLKISFAVKVALRDHTILEIDTRLTSPDDDTD